MDILTDILKTAGLRKRILNQHSLFKSWGLKFPCPQSIGFHVVTQGTAYLWKSNDAIPIILNKGDIAFMARGINHYITTHPDKNLINEEIDNHILPTNYLNKSPILTLVSGAYQLWNDPIHPLFYDFPLLKIISIDSVNYSDSLQHCLHLLSNEITNDDLGSEIIISSLLDVMFNLILRRILNEKKEMGWGNAVNEPLVLKALQLMHSEPSKEWTVEGLAQSVGLSRSGFALKFKQTLGDTPLNYLTTLRIFKSTDLLNNTNYNIEKIAHLVGYSDAFSFSKTFKRLIGVSPKNFKQKNDSEKNFSWRF